MTDHTDVDVRRGVRDRYARAATEGTGCCDSTCCGGTGADASPEAVSKTIGYSDDELADLPADANLGLGCGNPTALADLEPGQIVLDLGSGAGIDCFLAARRVGPTGRVIGVDMTPEMVERARASASEGGYENVEFRLGEIEALPLADESVDVVVSNCVLNLSADRGRVLAEVRRVLRPGGKVVVSDEPVPESLRGDIDAVAGCLPTPREAYLREFRDAGFADVRITGEAPYPAGYLLDDAGVREHLTAHPEQTGELTRFAASIHGAHFEATREG